MFMHWRRDHCMARKKFSPIANENMDIVLYSSFSEIRKQLNAGRLLLTHHTTFELRKPPCYWNNFLSFCFGGPHLASLLMLSSQLIIVNSWIISQTSVLMSVNLCMHLILMSTIVIALSNCQVIRMRFLVSCNLFGWNEYKITFHMSSLVSLQHQHWQQLLFQWRYMTCIRLYS
jgi:hypothetical protein